MMALESNNNFQKIKKVTLSIVSPLAYSGVRYQSSAKLQTHGKYTFSIFQITS